MKNSTQAIVVLPRLRVQNANLISSPITWGFPSMTTILGFVHALERKLKKSHDLKFISAGVVCHQFDPQVHGKYEKKFSLMRKPLLKDGSSAALVEEGRVHMELSVVIKAEGEAFNTGIDDLQTLADTIFETAYTLRIAGGSILPSQKRGKKYLPIIQPWPKDADQQESISKKLTRFLLPGFTLISQEKLMLDNKSATQWDNLLEFSSLNYDPPSIKEDSSEENDWELRKKPGWIVPITVGFKAISKLYPPGTVTDARDAVTPFQFVENLYSLGQWLSPHKIDNVEKMLWQFDYEQTQNGLYRCTNSFN
jgi:CRISPR-associated protein Csy2